MNEKNIKIFNCFFFSDLEKYGIKKVFGWDKRKNVFKFDKIFLPVNLPNHWICYEINMNQKEIFQYDSLSNQVDNLRSNLIMDYLFVKQKFFEFYSSFTTKIDLVDEIDKLEEKFEQEKENEKKELNKLLEQKNPRNGKKWVQFRINSPKDIPKQKNGFDCGVFTLYCILYRLFEKEFNYNQNNMRELKKYLLHLLILILEKNGFL